MDACNQEALKKYFYLSIYNNQGGFFDSIDLNQYRERHKINFTAVENMLPQNYVEYILKQNVSGVVIEMYKGNPCYSELKQATLYLKNKLPLWFYWPKENSFEFVDRDKLFSYWRHLVFIKSILQYRKLFRGLPTHQTQKNDEVIDTKKTTDIDLSHFYAKYPMKLQPSFHLSSAPICYLRLDFWANIKAGGSYGHTCYVANELNNRQEVIVMMPNKFPLLDKMGIKQIVLDRASATTNNLVLANDFYYRSLKALFQFIKPAFIYERICLGNYVGARLSQELNIPYVVEYNGSEISVLKTFENKRYEEEKNFILAEKTAFKHANVISVVSQVIADDLIKQGVPKEKVLVNPNGADFETYKPALPDEKIALREKYNLDTTHVVVGFIGTFGGWHGIDILAKAIPPICKANPFIRFLLIGHGNFRHLIDEVVRQHSLEDKVILTGMVPQNEAVDILKICDIYVSPHSSHMSDSLFFGSPTKLFEYMALAGGIVASNLMQIGDVLSPAIQAHELLSFNGMVANQRAVLCEPGNLQQFINGVVYLSKHLDVCRHLGENARKALIEHYSWKKHLDRLYSFINGNQPHGLEIQPQNKSTLNDGYKAEVQNQWDHNPCGSHYVKNAELHSLDWFLEAEKYRYDEYAPWMHKVMEFSHFANKKVLEIGGGMGTDLCQFAKHGAQVYDLDLSFGHLTHAKKNFSLRNLTGRFSMGDAECTPFADNTFDLVYSNGVIHHSPNTQKIISEIYRILKPGGMVKIMVYAENSLHYWRNLVLGEWLDKEHTDKWSIGEVMSRTVEISQNDAKPLVKVYTGRRIKKMFSKFEQINIIKRQLMRCELPFYLRWVSPKLASKLVGWNLIVTATKPGTLIND